MKRLSHTCILSGSVSGTQVRSRAGQPTTHRIDSWSTVTALPSLLFSCSPRMGMRDSRICVCWLGGK